VIIIVSFSYLYFTANKNEEIAVIPRCMPKVYRNTINKDEKLRPLCHKAMTDYCEDINNGIL